MSFKQVFSVAVLAVFAPSFVSAMTPNDPFVDQWSYRDTGVQKAWDITIGSNDVVVAVIDNGFDTYHPDLIDNVWKNEDEIADNGIDDDKNGFADDVWGWNFVPEDVNGDGEVDENEEKGNNDPRPNAFSLTQIEIENATINHGTLVAGIIGAKGNNKLDGSGINWNVKLMNIKVLGNSGSSEYSRLDEAIHYAVNNGANIINISMVSGMDDGITKAIEYAYKHNVAVVAAAGNNSNFLNLTPYFPVCGDKDSEIQKVLGVSGMKENHYNTRFSNFGSDCIDLTGPAEGISSTLRYAPRFGLKEQYGGGFNGTSFSTPFVSGALALIKSIQPAWSPTELYEAVLKTVHRTPPEDPEAYENLFGAGLLQIDKAVEYAFNLLPSFKTAKSFGFYTKDGLAVFDKQKNDFKVEQKDFLPADLEGVNTFEEGGKNYFIVWKKASNKTEVAIYNDEWLEISKFALNVSYPASVSAVDLFGDSGKEFAVYPDSSNNSVFSVFNKNGDLLGEKKENYKHNGVKLDVLRGSNDKDKIVAVYLNEKKEYAMNVFSGEKFDFEKQILLSYFKTLPNVSVGDIDNDKEQEFVVSSGGGQDSLISFFEQSGNWTRMFYAYGFEYKGEVKTVLSDMNNDGKIEIVTFPKGDNEQPVKIWNSSVKKINEFLPFAGKKNLSVFGFPIF